MKLKILLILLSLAIQSKPIIAKEIINWYHSNSPPFVILRGLEQGKGTIDMIIAFYQKRMPEYNHRDLMSNLPRFVYNVKNREKWCHAWMLKTPEREKFLYYSDPVSLVLPNHLIIKKEKFSAIDNKQIVSLENIFKKSKLKGRLIRSRSYGKKIDLLINQYKNSSNIKLVTQKEKQILEMLLLNRIDYTITYPVTAEYWAYQLNANEKLLIIPIEETQAVNKGYISCAKTAWGQKVIQRINQIVQKEKYNPEYRKLVTELWLSSNASKRMQKFYDQLLLGK